MASFWKTFWVCMGSLATVVGLYVGCATVGYEWAFWVTVGGSLLLALGWTVGPNVLTWGERVRDYPALLQQAGDLRVENSELVSGRKSLEAAAATNYDEGVAEGRDQVIGAIKAASVKVLPKLVGVQAANGLVILFAEATGSVPVGARFELEVDVTGESRGAVKVTEFDPATNVATLVCVDRKSVKFWERLEERAESDPSPPPGMRLGRIRFDDVIGNSSTQVAVESAPATAEVED